MREKERDMELILASGSPRRRELLSLYTTDFTVCVSDFDESTVTADTPAHLVEQLARGKCLAVAKDHPDAVVIGCDTVVDVNGEVFGKPHGVEDAKRMLRALSGSRPSGAHRRVREPRRPHRELCGQLQGDLLPAERGGDRLLCFHKGALRQGRCLCHPGPGSPLAGPASKGDYYTIMGLPVSRTAQLVERFV